MITTPVEIESNFKSPSLRTLSDRLIYALETQKITQAELARRIAVRPQAIQYLCGSKAEKSRFTHEIADALGVSATWLGYGKGSMLIEDDPAVLLIKSQAKIPLLDWRQIRLWKINANVIGHKELNVQKWIFTGSDIGDSGFAISLNDKSMYPRFDQETIIIINPSRAPKDKEFVIAYLKEIDDIVIRQYEISKNAVLLKPLNTSMYKIITMGKEDEIWGVVVEARWLT